MVMTIIYQMILLFGLRYFSLLGLFAAKGFNNQILIKEMTFSEENMFGLY